MISGSAYTVKSLFSWGFNFRGFLYKTIAESLLIFAGIPKLEVKVITVTHSRIKVFWVIFFLWNISQKCSVLETKVSLTFFSKERNGLTQSMISSIFLSPFLLFSEILVRAFFILEKLFAICFWLLSWFNGNLFIY